MRRQGRWTAWICLSSAMLTFVASGAIVLGSNMAFKFNKSLGNGFVAPGNPTTDNWIALPYRNPYPTFTALCNAFASAGANKLNISLSVLNPCTALYTNIQCLSGSSMALNPRFGVRVRVAGTSMTTSPDHFVLVGSHDDAIVLPDLDMACRYFSPGPKGEYWLSVPYHSTWIHAEDVCIGYGLGFTQGRVSIYGSIITSHPCGTSNTNFRLNPGQAIRVHLLVPITKTGVAPPHF